MKYLKIIGFDADDTLWENGLYFRQAEEQLALLLKDYIQPDSLHEQLYAVEMKNMPHYGYGGMAYTLSLIETAIQVSRGKIGNEIIECILDLGRAILTHPIELLSDVQEVLPLLQERYRLIIVTRGEILDQERKLKKSGLLPFFHHIEIVSEKNPDNYRHLLRSLGITPEEFMMVGNSLRFDVLPVLSIGGQAVHVPSPAIWAHEDCEKPSRPYYEISRLGELMNILP